MQQATRETAGPVLLTGPVNQTARLPAGLRARIWVEARHFFSRHDAQVLCWLWLLDADGRVHALRMDAAAHGRDDRLGRLLSRLRLDPHTPVTSDKVLGTVFPLPGAPVVPVPRWAVSWGHPLQRAIRAFAGELDTEVLNVLGQLEAPGPFFGSVDNYNRLLSLPGGSRFRRLQALQRFPPLVAPLLLDGYGRPDMYGTDEDEPAWRAQWEYGQTAPVLAAMDLGRDLVGALAAEYRVDRALVRSPLFATPWVGGRVSRERLALLQAMPAHARPRSAAALETRFTALAALPLRRRSAEDVARQAKAFGGGWDTTWAQLEAEFPALPQAMRDTRDFLASTLQQADLADTQGWLDMETLAVGWLARRGVVSLLLASRRWHAQPLIQQARGPAMTDEVLQPIFGVFECDQGKAVELTTRMQLVQEGEAMHHCVGGYWEACLTEPSRIVHLLLADGSVATAQFDFVVQAGEVTCELVALRGPCNDECGTAMGAFAERIRLLMNVAAHRAQRGEIVAAARSRAQQTRVNPLTIRLLDPRSRDELRQVLLFCVQQDDWRAWQHALYRGVIAGFTHAEGPQLLAQLAIGEPLQLQREALNAYDLQAVRIDWQGHKLGYVPRGENTAIAQALDAGRVLKASIAAVHSDDEWAPLECLIV